MPTKIEWLQRPGTIAESWNPIQDKRKGSSGRGYHCTKCSPGCVYCWAETMNKRFGNGLPFDNSSVEFEIVEKTLDMPLRWRKPRTIGVQLMGDLFHEYVPFEYIRRVEDIIESTPQHTYIILTKRPDRMLAFTNLMMDEANDPNLGGFSRWPDNVIGMVTAENQKQADIRIPILLRIPFARYGVSLEPLLGPIKARRWLDGYERQNRGTRYENLAIRRSGGPFLDWIICGSESGPGARPMDLDWVCSVRDQCQAADVRLVFKQKIENGKKISLPELDGRVWNEYPELACR